MAWLKVDDGFTIHPKITSLSDKDFRIWVRILCFSARNNSKDGALTGVKGELRGVTDKVIERFVAARLIDVGTDGVMRVHDWSDYAPGRSDPTNTERQARFRGKAKDVTAPEQSNVTPNADSHARAQPLPSPAPTQPPPKESSEPKGSSSLAASPPKERPANPHWDAFVKVCGPAVTPSEQQLRGKHVRDAKAMGATPEEIIWRGEAIRERYPDSDLTDNSLMKHWSKADLPLPKGKPVAKTGGLALADHIRASSEGAMRILEARRNGHHTLTADFELPALEETYDG